MILSRTTNILQFQTALNANALTDRSKQFISRVVSSKKGGIMPWPKGEYPPSYKNQPKYMREKATEIASGVLEESGDEGKSRNA